MKAGESGDRSADRVGEIVRAEREKRCLSQARLAGLAGVSPATVSAVELGRRATSLDLLDRLLSAMGLRLHAVAEPRFADVDTVIAAAAGRPVADIMAGWGPVPRARIAVTPLAQIEASSGQVRRVLERTRYLLAAGAGD